MSDDSTWREVVETGPFIEDRIVNETDGPIFLQWHTGHPAPGSAPVAASATVPLGARVSVWAPPIMPPPVTLVASGTRFAYAPGLVFFGCDHRHTVRYLTPRS